MDKFRIISLDGGGIRGVYMAAILERLVAAVPNFLADIDLYAGTSTGALIAFDLAAGRTPSDSVESYRRDGPTIFSTSIWRQLRSLWGFIAPRYDNKDFKTRLEQNFGQTTLGDLAEQGNYVLIPTYDLDAIHLGRRMGKAKFFHNFPGPDYDGAETIVDVALRATAAPSYFPAYQGYIDGGVVANNPSISALAQALEPHSGQQRLEDIRLISFGSGIDTPPVPGERFNWGIVQWAMPIFNIFTRGVSDVSRYQAEQVLTLNHYHRFNPILPTFVPLDAIDQIDYLYQQAQQVDIDLTVQWIQTNFL